jgi:hypothetical protein
MWHYHQSKMAETEDNNDLHQMAAEVVEGMDYYLYGQEDHYPPFPSNHPKSSISAPYNPLSV